MSAQDPAVPLPARPRRRRARWILLSLAGLVVLLLVCAALLAKEAFAARDALTEAIDKVPAVEEALRAGDGPTAQAALDDVQPLTTTARQNTDGPLWGVAGHLPFVGTDVRAFSTAARSVDEITQDVLPPLTLAVDALSADAVRPQDGAIDLAPLTAAAPNVADSAAAMATVSQNVGAIDAASLLPQLAGPITQLQDKVDQLDDLIGTADRVASLLPAMLGADGPRTYLLLSLNSAELRASGGIPGAMVVLTADAGKLTLTQQAATQDVGPFPEPVLPLDPQDEAIYSDRLGRFVQDVTLTPDFPTSAQLAAAMWQKSQGETVDGVIATDPVALSYLLDATGPIEVAGMQLDSGNVVETLLSTAYQVLEQGPQTDAFFAAVAGTVFTSVLSGSSDVTDLQGVMDKIAGERRLLVWSAHEDEQARLLDTIVSGAIDTSEHAADAPGLFFNDGTGAKMSFYLGSEISLVDSECTAEGRVDTVQLALHSDAPKNALDVLPSYVTGEGFGTVTPGVIRTNVVLYSPRGGKVLGITQDDTPIGGVAHDAHGRAVVVFTQDLDPDQSTTIQVRFLTASGEAPGEVPGGDAGSTAAVDVWSTPTARAPGMQTIDVPTCG